MIEVKVKPGESLNTALARFKKICGNAKIRQEVMRRRFYEKPSTKRRRLMLRAQRKQRPDSFHQQVRRK